MSQGSSYFYKIVLLGEGAVGKTSLRRRYMGLGFTKSHLMTLGADFSFKDLTHGEHTIRCQLWDLAGQAHFKGVRSRFLANTQGAILVYDLTREETLPLLANWLLEPYSISVVLLFTGSAESNNM